MREILNLQLGQCGNNIGTKFWEIITNEHGLNSSGIYEGENDLQLQRINVYFNDGSQGKYVPRSVMIDLDGASLEYIKNSNIGDLFRCDQFIGGMSSASNNYAKGFYTDGAQLIDQIMELIRIEVENCEMLQGFQMFHGLGGGTGTGLGALVLSKIREEYTDRIISTISIMPNPKVSEVVLEPYNCTLGMKSLALSSDENILFDNESLSRICITKLRNDNVTNADRNNLIGKTISTITSSLRFPGQLNSDLRKIAVNMIPFPELHFFLPSYSPLGKFDHLYKDGNVKSVIRQVFRDGNIMLSTNTSDGRYITATVIVRGRVSTKDVDETIIRIQDKNHRDFVDYIPNNISSAICDINPHQSAITAAALSNHSSVATVFEDIHDRFGFMYNRKAYLHWYIAEGLEIGEFQESSKSLMNVIDKYQTTAESGDWHNKKKSKLIQKVYKIESVKEITCIKSNITEDKNIKQFPMSYENVKEKTNENKDLTSLSISISEAKSFLNSTLPPY